jgi:hypothetical protein
VRATARRGGRAGERRRLRAIAARSVASAAAVIASALGLVLVELGWQPVRAQDVAEAEAARGERRVVFVVPELDEDADAQLRDALLAQFTLVNAELSFAPPRSIGRTQAERLSALAAVAARADALATFYLDVESSGRWLLHVFDASRERLVLRPLDGSGAQRASAIEAVAVMTRESTRALIEGQPLPEPSQPVPAAPAEPEPAPAPAPPPPSTRPPPASRSTWLRPRLSLGYVATTFGDESSARQGVAFSLGQRLSDDLRVSLGADLTLPVRYEPTPPFEVRSVPVRVGVALRMAETRTLALELEGVVTLEWLVRQSLEPESMSPTSPTVERAPDAVDFVAAAGLRAHGELALGGPWALWIALGSDILFNPYAYIAYTDQVRHELLALYRVRLLGQLGVAVDL